jgi:type I restriction enzyme, S subunit
MTAKNQSSVRRSEWRQVRLGELAKDDEAFADGPFGSNLKTEHYSREGARVVRLQNIGRGVFLDADKAFVSLEHFSSLRRHNAVPGDVVVAALGDGVRPAGRACVLPSNLGPAMVKADCFRIRLPGMVILPEFLSWYLNSPQALSRIAASMRGATRSRVTISILKGLEILLPSLSEQARVLRVLVKAIEGVERARAAAEVRREAIEALTEAELRRAFKGFLPLSSEQTQATPPPGWKWRLLTSVARLETGHTPSRNRPDWWGGDIPWISLSDIRELDGRIARDTREWTNAEGIANSAARVLPAGTVVLSRTASGL